MNLRGYIKRFGDKSFSKFAFNDVDAAVFAYLSYLNWELYAPNIENKNSPAFSFKHVIEERIGPLTKDIPETKEEAKIIRLASKSKRYKNCKVKFIHGNKDFEKKKAFFACTYEIPTVGHYVCFRGTDLSVLAWEENLIQSLNIVTSSQEESLDYLYKVSRLIDGDFYVGGHSKGGNLAIYSCMNIPFDIQDRIIKVYSFDGTGFYSNDFYELENYKRIENKILRIIPTDSFVGIIFYTPKKYKIVSSRYISVFQHFLSSWRTTKNGDFKYKKKRTYMSFVRHRALRLWVDCADNETKALTVDSIVTALGGPDKDITLYVKHPGFIWKTYLLWRKKYTKEQKKIIAKYTRQLFKHYISSFFYCMKKKNRLKEE